MCLPYRRRRLTTVVSDISLRLAGLANNGGKARIIASPKLDRDDCAALNQGADARNDATLRAALNQALEDLEQDLARDTLAALAWMVADGLLEFRIAIPTGEQAAAPRRSPKSASSPAAAPISH